MAKPPFDPQAIGLYRRGYDALSEEDAEDKLEIARVLKWMKEPVAEKAEEKKSKNKLKELLDAGAELDQLSKIPGLSELKDANQKGMVIDKLWEVSKDLYFAGRDILSSNRVKTSLTILGGIAVGAAVGAVLGTLVFPGIGTAAGGAVGAAITSGVAAVGGAVGLSILGGFVGSWFGKKVADKVFKEEKHFQISKRVTKKIKSRIGISSKTTQMINGYLYNRAKTIKSPMSKEYYKTLRKLGVLEASPTGMEKISRFFCNELLLLEEELAAKDSPALRNEIEAVRYILQKLQAAPGLSTESKTRIAQTFKEYKGKQHAWPTAKTTQGVEYDTVEEVTPEVLARSTKNFLDSLPEGIKSVNATNKRSPNGSVSYRYQLQTKEGEKLPELTLKSKKDKQEHIMTKVTVKANELNDSNMHNVTNLIVAQAKAYTDTTNKKDVTVLAAGNDNLAVELMVAIIKAGLKPTLSEQEYPSQDEKAQARKRDILSKVDAQVRPQEPLKTRKSFEK